MTAEEWRASLHDGKNLLKLVVWISSRAGFLKRGSELAALIVDPLCILVLEG